jgi:hypothetical protein
VAAAFVVIAVLLALLSPVANPERLSVANQLARLKAGKVAPAEFDYAYLRFEGGRYGQEALAQLRSSVAGKDAETIRKGVDEAQALQGPWQRRQPGEKISDLAANLTVWPAGARLPDTFMAKAWAAGPTRARLPRCLTHADAKCDAFMLDLHGDATQEVVLVGVTPHDGSAVMAADKDGKWRMVGSLRFAAAGCKPLREAIAAGNVAAVARADKDIVVGGKRLPVVYEDDQSNLECSLQLPSAPAPDKSPR